MRNKPVASVTLLLAALLVSGCGGGGRGVPMPSPPRKPALTYIGLKEKTNVRDAEEYVLERYKTTYTPKLRLIGDYLYATTVYGLYRKNIGSTDDTQWELYAFEGEPVLDFAQSGGKLLAVTSNHDDKAMLLSEDDGRTCSGATPEAFLTGDNPSSPVPVILTFSQSPADPNSLLMLAATPNPELFGLLKSTDFGKSWRSLRPYIFGYQNWVSIFDQHDPATIYCAGEEAIFESVIYSSNNDGRDWSAIESMMNSCVHHIAFHPSDPDVMIYSGEYLVKKSTDRGRTWDMVLRDDIYFYKTVYDAANPDIVYASGSTRAPNTPHLFTVHRSTNGGDDWSVFFQTDLPGEGGIIDMELRGDRLFLYTYTDGIYKLAVDG